MSERSDRPEVDEGAILESKGRKRARPVLIGGTALLLTLAIGVTAAQLSTGGRGPQRTYTVGAAEVTVVEHPRAKGLMVTSGGWAYCQQLRALARNSSYTLLCGRFPKDGYVGHGLRSRRHLDWGDTAYLSSLAGEVNALHRRVGGELVLVGVSYSGFGVATLASHQPGLRPDRVIVIDSYLDLVARRAAAGTGGIGREIDDETGGTPSALDERNVRVDRLAELVRAGTRLQVVWTVAAAEAREFKGATCNLDANARFLQRLANTLRRPVTAWVTTSLHGHDLWDHGLAIMAGTMPGRRVELRPRGQVPAWAVCG